MFGRTELKEDLGMKLLHRRNNKYKWSPNGKELGKLKGQLKKSEWLQHSQ